MNWKIVIGILIIIGGISEFLEEQKDYQTGVTTYNPIIPQIFCIAMIGVGFYLIYKGRKRKIFK
jgi:hypothetical protein